MTRTNDELIGDALAHIAALKRHLDRTDLADETVADAVSLRLAAAIESLSDLDLSLRDRLFGEEWKVIWATRNRIAHGYAHADVGVIRDTAENDLPDLEKQLLAYQRER